MPHNSSTSNDLDDKVFKQEDLFYFEYSSGYQNFVLQPSAGPNRVRTKECL